MLSRKAILGHVESGLVASMCPRWAARFALRASPLPRRTRSGRWADGVPAVTALVILGACDEDGKRLFTDEDVAALNKLPASALGKVANAILAHNGLAGDAEEAKNA
jgi:hypothetical protein